MTIQEMHYDFKMKLNKLDSHQNRNLRVPEIDWKLNEALEIFIKLIAEPRVNNHLGFETNQRTIDDIRTLVVGNYELTPRQINNNTYVVELPENYMFYLSSEVILDKPNCKERVARTILRQHDDRFEDNPLEKSSFEWKEVNIQFFEGGIRIFTDGTFSIKTLKLNYLKKHTYIHNAQDFLPTQSYTLLNGRVLTGRQDCELPEHTHREIVDIAVLLVAGELSLQDYQFKQAKLTLNQIN